MLYMVVSNEYTDNHNEGGSRYEHFFKIGELVERFATDYTSNHRTSCYVDIRDLVLIGKI